MSTPPSMSTLPPAPPPAPPSELPIFGLVLAGGRSTRMRRDKASLAYRGRSHLEAAVDLLAPLVERCFVSVRPDQVDEPLRRRFAQIVDRQESLGPIAGILAAQHSHPQVAWLVVACDLPFLHTPALQQLIAQRDRGAVATAFRSAHDTLPEPLCAIYEPRSAAALVDYAAAGGRCPRKFLLEQQATLLEPIDARALDNINSPQEYWQSMQTLAPDHAALRTVHVQYFALLREQAGHSRESLRSAARTPAELYAELQARYAFSLPAELLKVAVNGDFGDWAQPLQDGDTVVFIPPVAGG